MKQTLNTESLMQISLFERITKAKVKDCFEDSFKQLTFCVMPGQIFKAIGKRAEMIKRLDKLFKKKLRIIEYDPDVKKFIKNLCHPNKVVKVEYSEAKLWDETKRTAVITPADVKSRGYLIGKDAANLRNMESIVQRYFKIDEIKVGQAEIKVDTEAKAAQLDIAEDIETPEMPETLVVPKETTIGDIISKKEQD